MQIHPVHALHLFSSIVTVGALDGVHLGHQALINGAKCRANSLGVPLVVYTFDPPPKVLFQGVQPLTTIYEKLSRLELLGVDHTVVAPFNEQYVNRSAESFLHELSQFMPVEIWSGPDFHFGKNKRGDIQTLKEKYEVQVVSPVRCQQGEAISSSRIRRLTSQKRYMEADVLMGWSVQG
ncbi:FAD synthetase family protein [Bacillus marasmi]|uniref:FAD synthetase family protein n=1 Tax=Bacillus marasmi TaxID=1926279 RepID=UPI0011C728FD|nr:FAD synthetase family protein [Bacillus marasmi]